MAEPKLRFKNNHNNFPMWEQILFSSLFEKVTEKNNGTFGADKIISVANMYYKENTGGAVLTSEYMKTYNVMRYGDIAFEGNKSKNYSHGRFVANTIGDGIVSHVFDVFRPKQKLVLDYWKIFINYEPIMGRILSRCTKSSTMMTNLVAKDFLKEQVSVPCPQEQEKIAAFLISIDSKLETEQKELDNLELVKKGFMQKIFSQELRFKDDNGNDYPEWEEKKLAKLLAIPISNGVFSDPNKKGNGKRLINVVNLYSAPYINYTELELIDISGKEFELNKVKKGDLFLTRSSLKVEGIAHCNIYLNDDEQVVYDGHIMRVRVDNSICKPIYFYYHAKTDFIRKQFMTNAKTTTMTTIDQKAINNTIVKLPCLLEQTKIAAFLSSIDSLIDKQRKIVEDWKEIKKGFLQQLFPSEE